MRDIRVDLLRALGLAMIVLAHVGPPAPIMQLRNFDVPLMVLVSGMSFALSFNNDSYSNYLWKRIKRLLFPVWIFLTVYFGALNIINPASPELAEAKIWRSYFLIDGIGFVWIIKVFLLVAAVSPFLYRYHKKVSNHAVYFSTVMLALGSYEILRIISQDIFSSDLGQKIALVSHYIIPYSLIFAIGLRFPSLSMKAVGYCMLVAAAFFFGLAAYFWHEAGGFVPTQYYKYPPTFYYFSYAIAVSCAMWILSRPLARLMSRLPPVKTLLLFVAQNSIWVYLWHIPFAKSIHTHFPIKFTLVFSLATALTFVQVWIVNNLLARIVTHQASQRNIKMIFTG